MNINLMIDDEKNESKMFLLTFIRRKIYNSVTIVLQ